MYHNTLEGAIIAPFAYRVSCPFLIWFWFVTLSPSVFLGIFQAAVALQEVGWKEVYPMDFYSNQSLGPWAPNHPDNQPVRPARRQTQVNRAGR